MHPGAARSIFMSLSRSFEKLTMRIAKQCLIWVTNLKNILDKSVPIGKNQWRWWNYAFLLHLSPIQWFSDTNWEMHSLTPDSNPSAWHAIHFASLHCRYFSPPNLPSCQKRGSLQQWLCALSFPEEELQTLNLQQPHTWPTLSGGGAPLHLPFHHNCLSIVLCAFCVQHQKHESLFCVSVCLLCGCARVHAQPHESNTSVNLTHRDDKIHISLFYKQTLRNCVMYIAAVPSLIS